LGVARHRIQLFEYQDSDVQLNNEAQRIRLEQFLKQLWKNRYCAYGKELESDENYHTEDLRYRKQPFLRFDGNGFRSQNFIGFIQFENLDIEIYPKVFKSAGMEPAKMLQQVFFWFNYCRKLHFPVLENSLDKMNCDSFPELLIWNFSKHCHSTLIELPFSHYVEKEEALQTVKGRISFPDYIRNGLSTGKYNQIDCIYESFEFDNKLNRSIKHVCRYLHSYTRMQETRDLLKEILFLLDEVTDESCSSTDLDSVVINSIFSDYIPIKEWCKRFLEQQLYSSSSVDSMQWSLLLPMEYVFEDFVAGFMQEEFSSKFTVEPQRSNFFLTKGEQFQLRHDILITAEDGSGQFIIDTKYKLRSVDDLTDKKGGVVQADMYQMVSYGHRRGCKRVILLYPNQSDMLNKELQFEIDTAFDPKPEIVVNATEIVFWSTDFVSLKNEVRNSLTKVLRLK
jgi:5-methylcytosine-specific restriction enzyme subunit McrC